MDAPPKLTILHDHLSDRIDEIADMCEVWKRWRTTRRTVPHGVRAALVGMCREAVLLAELEHREGPGTEATGALVFTPAASK